MSLSHTPKAGLNSTKNANQANAWTVFALAWPMTLKAIILHGTVVIDAYLVSSLGETALAAMGLAAAMAGFVLGGILAFSNALQIRTAQAFGSADPVFLKSTLASGLAVNIAVGIVGLIFLSVLGGPIIATIAINQEMATLATDYLTVFSLVIMGEAVGQCLSTFFNGCGRTKLPLYSFCLSLPVNVVTSIILIHGYFGLPAYGVTGAAMGSAIAVCVQVGFLLIQFIKSDSYLLKVVGWRQTRFIATLKRHIAFSSPIAATFLSATVSTHVCTLIYAKLSLNEFAAMTLIAPWIMVAGTIGMQWAQATGIVVAQLLGQKEDPQRLDQFLSQAWRGAFVAAAVVAAIFLSVCLSANVIYSDLHPETRLLVLGFLPILLLLPFPKGSNAICGNTLRASGDTIYVMQIFLWSQWLFRVPATALAVLYFELPVFWVVSVFLIEEIIKLPAFHRRLFKGQWKTALITN